MKTILTDSIILDFSFSPENSKTELAVYAYSYNGELVLAQEKRNYYRLSKADAKAEL